MPIMIVHKNNNIAYVLEREDVAQLKLVTSWSPVDTSNAHEKHRHNYATLYKDRDRNQLSSLSDHQNGVSHVQRGAFDIRLCTATGPFLVFNGISFNNVNALLALNNL